MVTKRHHADEDAARQADGLGSVELGPGQVPDLRQRQSPPHSGSARLFTPIE